HDLRPSIVEDYDFKCLNKEYLELDYKMPVRSTFIHCLQDWYSLLKTMAMDLLEKPTHLALTNDFWTSLAQDSFMTSWSGLFYQTFSKRQTQFIKQECIQTGYSKSDSCLKRILKKGQEENIFEKNKVTLKQILNKVHNLKKNAAI
ncbi:unnamed protein product, partial [Owenia fusiformis]